MVDHTSSSGSDGEMSDDSMVKKAPTFKLDAQSKHELDQARQAMEKQKLKDTVGIILLFFINLIVFTI